MAKEFEGNFPGGSVAGGKSPAAQDPFVPGTAPVDAGNAAETPPPFDDLGLPMVPVSDVLPPELEEDVAGHVPDFLDDLFL